VWDVGRERLASVLEGHTGSVVGSCFAPTGHLLATNSWDGTARVWNAATGEPLVSTPTHVVGFSPDGRRLAFQDGTTLGLWDVAFGEDIRTLNPTLIGNRTGAPSGDFMLAAGFSSDSRLLALGRTDGTHLVDARSGQDLARLNTGKCESVLFDRDGLSLITCGERGLFRWPIRPDPAEGVGVVQVGPPESLYDGNAHQWSKMSRLPNRLTLALIDNTNARVLLVDAALAHPARRRARVLSSGANRRMTSIAVSPDRRWAAAGGWKEAGIPVRDLTRRRLERILPPSDSEGENHTWVAFSPGGRWLVCCSHNPAASGYYFWEVGTWKRGPFVAKSLSAGAAEPAFSADGRILAMSITPLQVRLAEAETGRTIAHLSTLQPLRATPMAFSPDGSWLIASSNQKTALLWNLRLIRQRLQAMGLDWDQAPLPPENGSP
jgi:WD40 repeat protein